MYEFLDPKGKEIKMPPPKRKVVSYSTGAKMVTVISKFKD